MTEPAAKLEDQLRAGSAEALAGVYRQHVQAVWRFVHRRTGQDHATTDDLVSHIFLAMLESLEHYDARQGTLEGWLYAIVRRKIADHLRHWYRHRRHRQTLVARCAHRIREADAPQQLARLVADEDQRRVHEVLSRMSPIHRDVLIWAHCEDLSVQRVADRIGRSPKAAENLLYRARQRFKAAYLHMEDAPPPAAVSAMSPPASEPKRHA